MRRFVLLWFCFLGMIGCTTPPSPGRASPPQSSTPASSPTSIHASTTRPKLAIILVIDMLNGDYLAQHQDLFVDDGLTRLMRQGAWFTVCEYEHASTATGPGHACISTGANPRVHGIVDNEWFYLDNNNQFVETKSVGDPQAHLLGLPEQFQSKSKGASPKWLLAQTIGEQLKTSHPQSRVVSVAIKDRSAILLAGKNADGAFWWNSKTGLWVTSTHYFSQTPEWFVQLNQQKPANPYYCQTWNRLLDPAVYEQRCTADDMPYELNHTKKRGNTFPYQLRSFDSDQPDEEFYAWLYDSPFGNDLTLEFARRLVDQYQLAQRETTDLLLISLSSVDAVGHLYGQDSQEYLDVILRTDRQLADFFRFLDQRISSQKWIIALTADHGVGMVPELAQTKKLNGGRLDTKAFTQRIETLLTKAHGTPPNGHYVSAVKMPWLFLNPQSLTAQRVNSQSLQVNVAQAASEIPGLAGLYFTEALEQDTARFHADPLVQLIKNCIYPNRSGQFYLHLQENWQVDDHVAGHGTAHRYDRHVPLLWYGPGIRAGKYDFNSSPTDIAPTLSAILEIPPPAQSTGRVLKEALQK